MARNNDGGNGNGGGGGGTKRKKEVRVWADGCFDLMHYGHANALRQAKGLGTYLVVGVHSDAEIRRNKGPPLMNEQERYAAVRACKWVDEVCEAAPYVVDTAVLDRYNIDFVAHGDDITLNADGEDCYAGMKAAGRYREFKRTNGVSSTDLVGRLLLLTRVHHNHEMSEDDMAREREMSEGPSKESPYTGLAKFVPTVNRIVQFSEGREPQPGDRIVYVGGAFDLFHARHIELLAAAKALGDFLVVGVHEDSAVNALIGANFPIQNLHERVLSVLSCVSVDEVIIGAPVALTADIIKNVNISVVVDSGSYADVDDMPFDEFAVPRAQGILQTVATKSDLTVAKILRRVFEHRMAFEERNRKKSAKEVAYIEKAAEAKAKAASPNGAKKPKL